MLTSGNCVLASIAKPAEKPINEPNVARYSTPIIHRWARFRTGNCSFKEALDVARSFMPNQAAMVKIANSGTQTHAAFSRNSMVPSACSTPVPPNTANMESEITSGATNCITLTPRLPKPPLIPSAPPCFAFGKKKLMFAMLEAKFAPAKPHSNAIMINTLKGVAGFCTAKPNHTQGMIKIPVLNAVQRRPPNTGTIKE
ncbi:hypothetical protein D3C75_700540 [compost metagenome]